MILAPMNTAPANIHPTGREHSPITMAVVAVLIAALLHVACIVGGPAWYRFFGAGERMAR